MQYVKSICVKNAVMQKVDWPYWYAVMQKFCPSMQLCRNKIAKYAIMQKALGGPRLWYDLRNADIKKRNTETVVLYDFEGMRRYQTRN